MKDAELYRPSLSQEAPEIKSYNIGSLFYVAFFGGTIALTVLSIRNARWLRLRPAVIVVMVVLGMLAFIGKMALFYAYFNGNLSMERQSVKFLVRAFEIVLFLLFYKFMKGEFQSFRVLHGETQPLWKAGLAWSFVSLLIEGVLLVFIAGTSDLVINGNM